MSDPTTPPDRLAGKMCSRHAIERSRWLDYRLPPPPLQFVQIGRPASAEELGKRRFEQWRDTIRRQQGLIAGSCTDGVGCGAAEGAFGPVPRCVRTEGCQLAHDHPHPRGCRVYVPSDDERRREESYG